MAEINLNTIVQKIIKSKSAVLISKKIKPLSACDSYFVASLYHVGLNLEYLDGTQQTLELIVKFVNEDSAPKGILPYKLAYLNEKRFYEEYATVIGPKLQAFIPKFYFANFFDNNEGCIVIEYLNGYKSCAEERFLTNETIEWGCRKLGEFHGLGYVAKGENLEKYDEMCLQFYEIRHSETVFGDFCEIDNAFRRYLSKRIFDYYLPNKASYSHEVLEKYRKMVEDPKLKFEKQISRKNNLAILCHGDYNKNNMLFKYENERIQEIKLIDFQTLRYAQPGLDITNFFASNIKADDLEQNYEKYLKIYHEAVIETIKSNSTIDLDDFSYDRFLEDYAIHLWMGYVTILFFHPLLDDPTCLQVPELLGTKWSDQAAVDGLLQKMGTEETLKNSGIFLKHCIDLNEKLFNKNRTL